MGERRRGGNEGRGKEEEGKRRRSLEWGRGRRMGEKGGRRKEDRKDAYLLVQLSPYSVLSLYLS